MYLLCCPVNVPQTTGGLRSVGPLIVNASRRSHLPAPVIGGLSLPPWTASSGWGPLPGDKSTRLPNSSGYNYSSN